MFYYRFWRQLDAPTEFNVFNLMGFYRSYWKITAFSYFVVNQILADRELNFACFIRFLFYEFQAGLRIIAGF